jgi:hypothetical protein
MWDRVYKITGSKREQQLCTDFRSDMLLAGSQLERFCDTYESA